MTIEQLESFVQSVEQWNEAQLLEKTVGLTRISTNPVGLFVLWFGVNVLLFIWVMDQAPIFIPLWILLFGVFCIAPKNIVLTSGYWMDAVVSYRKYKGINLFLQCIELLEKQYKKDMPINIQAALVRLANEQQPGLYDTMYLVRLRHWCLKRQAQRIEEDQRREVETAFQKVTREKHDWL